MRLSEVEFKLALDPGDIDALNHHPLFASRTKITRTLRTVYFDTPSQSLARRALSLRVRTDGDRVTQTLKATRRASAGLFRRDEWECSLETPTVDPDRFTERGARARLKGVSLRKRLEPLLVTEMQRTAWALDHDGSQIEAALDIGQVSWGSRSEPLCELELELKEGEAAAVVALARRLSADLRLRVGIKSKSERGYALGQGQDTIKIKGRPLSRKVAAAEGFRALVRLHLQAFRDIEDRLLADPTPARLVETRAALGRLCSALAATDDSEAGPVPEGLRDTMAALLEALGPIESGDGALPAARAALDGAAFRVAVVDLATWCDQTVDKAKKERRFGKAAARLLDERRRALKAYRSKLDESADRASLQAAITALANGATVFAPVFDRDRAAAFRRRLARLGEVLDAEFAGSGKGASKAHRAFARVLAKSPFWR